MSLSGGISRSLDVLTFKWERHIIEHQLVLAPGWALTITVPFMEFDVQSFGWTNSLKDRLLRTPFFSTYHNGAYASWAGFSIGFQANDYNTGELLEHGDYAERRRFR